MPWCGGARPPNTRDCQGYCGGGRKEGGVTAGWRKVEENGGDRGEEGREEAKEEVRDDTLNQAPEEDIGWKEEGVEDALDHTVKKAPKEELYRVPQPNPK